jgi:hypothetical protein
MFLKSEDFSKIESQMLDEISLEEPWKIVEEFSKLVRVSSSEDERKAAMFLVGRLRELGISVEVYEPELYLSIPLHAEINVLSPMEESVHAKTPSFSASGSIEGDVVYVPSRRAKGTADLFDMQIQSDIDVRGRIVITEGLSIMPQAIRHFEENGAIGQIAIHPGERIHEGIATSIWGTPTPDNFDTKPQTPLACVNRIDGERLKEQAERGSLRLRITTQLDEGWKRCLLPVAEIKGSKDPDKFVLLHGHYDSWHYGVGDNAVGDGAMLEIARVFNKYKDSIERSVRIAWWPGHSTGRYAGSTWYCDQFGVDLVENCIAQVNCDSPGCRWASSYHEVMIMAEAEELCKNTIRDVTGLKATRVRPVKAGDYTFNNIGLTSFYMLLSNMPKEVASEKGLYAVGGCGGNIEWHTEADTIEIADKEYLLRDIKVYLATILRVVNAEIYPFDFRRTVTESLEYIQQYSEEAGSRFDLSSVIRELSSLNVDLKAFYDRLIEGRLRREDSLFKEVNRVMIRLGRILIPLAYAREGTFDHDPAVPTPHFPDMALIRDLRRIEETSGEEKVILNQLTRKRNRLLYGLRQAREVVQEFPNSLS